MTILKQTIKDGEKKIKTSRKLQISITVTKKKVRKKEGKEKEKEIKTNDKQTNS